MDPEVHSARRCRETWETSMADERAALASDSSQAASSKKVAPVIAVAALAIVGLVVWRLFFAGPSTPSSIVELTGRVEGDDSAVAAKVAGRILEVRVREGDDLKAGDVIAVLDDRQVQSRHDQAQAALTAAAARTASARAQVAVLAEQLKQTQLSFDQSENDSQGRVAQAEADLSAAEADRTQREASLKLALFDKDAYTVWSRRAPSRNAKVACPFRRPISRKPRSLAPTAASRR